MTFDAHQDNVIAVKERRDVAGFTAWSQKAGVWQVQALGVMLDTGERR